MQNESIQISVAPDHPMLFTIDTKDASLNKSAKKLYAHKQITISYISYHINWTVNAVKIKVPDP